MAITYAPKTIAEYHRITQRLKSLEEEYQSIEDHQEATAFLNKHLEDLQSTVLAPPLNALIIEEFLEAQEDHQRKLREAILEFKKIPEGMERPQNAITLWKAICHGLDRVASSLGRAR